MLQVARRNAGLYAELSKHRLSALVVVTAGAGYAAGGGALDPTTLSALCVGTGLAAGSANTFNQAIEHQRDRLMKRTCERPLPSGRMTLPHALGWGVVSGASSVGILAAGTNPVCTGLGLANIVLYAGPYTLSKPVSEWNTWVGAVVGAIPPVMGWAAAGGSVLDPEAAILASTLFLWQFPHFFSLAWIHRKDYTRGHHQMVPVNDPTGERTAALVRNYSLMMLPLPVLAAAADTTSWMFAVEGITATGYAVHLAHQFHQERSNENARKVFRCSLWWLPLMLFLFVFHRKEKNGTDGKDVEPGAAGLAHDDQALLDRVRAFTRELCVHEHLVRTDTLDGSNLCPNSNPIDTKAANAPIEK